MPSLNIPRSKAGPHIDSPDTIRSSESVRSALSTGSRITAWQNKLVTISPYYKGLTDFSLAINRERLSGSSPGRESHATSFVSSDSKSSFVVKMQAWGTSCFTLKKHESTHDQTSASSSTKSSNSTHYKASSSSSLSEIREASVKSKDIVKSSTNEKPLRERETKSPYCMLPLAPPTAPPPEDVPYPLPQITLHTAQALSLPLPTSFSDTQTPPPTLPQEESFPYLPPSPRQAPPSRKFY